VGSSWPCPKARRVLWWRCRGRLRRPTEGRSAMMIDDDLRPRSANDDIFTPCERRGAVVMGGYQR
jgi:hypothetical protein